MRGRIPVIGIGIVLAVLSLIGGLWLTGQPPATSDVVAGTEPTGKVSNWPRPYDPTQPLDFSGVAGVTEAQEQRAVSLVTRTLATVPQWEDFDATVAAGWSSLGGAVIGYKHIINNDFLDDDFFLDPEHPESLLYRVEGSRRKLVALMFIARETQSLNDEVLLDYSGRLMEWHNHDDLCIRLVSDDPVGELAGFVDADGKCQATGAVPAVVAGIGLNHAMVHVWVVSNPCGPFAALEGAARGLTLTPTDERVDICS